VFDTGLLSARLPLGNTNRFVLPSTHLCVVQMAKFNKRNYAHIVLITSSIYFLFCLLYVQTISDKEMIDFCFFLLVREEKNKD
jgi:hypothetical protein